MHNRVAAREGLRQVYCLFLISLAIAAPCTALGQTYPVRPVTVLIGNAPGSASDILARTVSEELKNALKQSFVAINRPGANASIVVESFRRAKPDKVKAPCPTIYLDESESQILSPDSFYAHPDYPIDSYRISRPQRATSLVTISAMDVVFLKAQEATV